jgi:hypothetical protein
VTLAVELEVGNRQDRLRGLESSLH